MNEKTYSAHRCCFFFEKYNLFESFPTTRDATAHNHTISKNNNKKKKSCTFEERVSILSREEIPFGDAKTEKFRSLSGPKKHSDPTVMNLGKHTCTSCFSVSQLHTNTRRHRCLPPTLELLYFI